MRNPVAKHDFNRAATHPDRSKEPQLTVDEGLLDYYAENAENVAQSVLDDNWDNIVVGLTPSDLNIVPMVDVSWEDVAYVPAKVREMMEGMTQEEKHKFLFGYFSPEEKKIRKPFPGLKKP